ncbi:MAG: hypothetical protein GXO22_06360 [Aquificae bacterium]|nr:hypothetical protein [Aquificota bacterium]
MKMIALITFILAGAISAFAEDVTKDNYFTDFGNAVGYIETDDGRKYIVVETTSGAKLIEVKEDPEKILKGSKGISREDFKIK